MRDEDVMDTAFRACVRHPLDRSLSSVRKREHSEASERYSHEAPDEPVIQDAPDELVEHLPARPGKTVLGLEVRAREPSGPSDRRRDDLSHRKETTWLAWHSQRRSFLERPSKIARTSSRARRAHAGAHTRHPARDTGSPERPCFSSRRLAPTYLKPRAARAAALIAELL